MRDDWKKQIPNEMRESEIGDDQKRLLTPLSMVTRKVQKVFNLNFKTANILQKKGYS